MSSDAGPSTRDTTRTIIAVLIVFGFVFIAAVLPVVGGQAPGASLFPQNATDSSNGQGARGALQELLGGQQGRQSEGHSGLVDGLMSRLARGGGGPLGGRRQAGSGSGRSAFGALSPGSRTSVGSRGSPLSRSLRNQSAIPHLVVESAQPSYWRTGAYGVYTGTGWEARGEPRQRVFPLPVTGSRSGRQVLRQEIRLLRPATSLPAAWEVTNVRGITEFDIRVTRRRGLKTATPVPANTTYTAISRAPPRDPARLRDAGRNYPTSIERRYTQLPDGMPDRVAAFTDQLTSEADTPFETARRIEAWLEANKNYSLQASHSGGNVAATFIFEMERGYCEYFATAMTVMLRTQGIPARYAVGYSTGQPVGNDTYVVRAMNAHAWVEVYFPNTGWVRFDPTPGRSRLARESRLFQRAMGNASAREVANRFLDMADSGGRFRPRRSGGGQQSGSGLGGTGGQGGSDAGGNGTAANRTNPYNHTERGSPGESFDPSGGPAYGIELLGDPVPGQRIAVEVTREGEAAVNVVVTFNGEPVGVTNRSGIVTGEIPFASRLVVGVDGTRTVADTNATSAGLFVATTLAFGPEGAGALVTGRDGPAVTEGGTAVARRDNGTDGVATTRSFDVPTAINVSLSGTLDPGATATVRATISGSPVADATVSLDGQRAGITGPGGEAQVQLPATERVTVAVRRGEAAGNRTVRLANVNVSVSGFALPGLTVTVTVTDEGEPVEGATVAVVDGSTSVTTGPDGTAALSLPFSTAVSLRAVTPAGIAKTRPVQLRFLTAGFGLLFAVTLVGGLLRVRQQATRAGRSVGAQLLATIRWMSGAFVSLLVGFGVWGERVLGRLPALTRGLAARASDAASAVVAAIRDRDRRQLPNPVALVAALLARLMTALRSAGSSVGGPIPTPGPTDAGDHEHEPAGTDDPVQSGPTARQRIRTVWRDFRERLPVDDYEHRTPGELSRTALEEGHPTDPVRTLTEAVRAIEYGRRDPHTVVEDAESAYERIAFAADQAGNYETDRSEPPEDEGATVPDGGDDS